MNLSKLDFILITIITGLLALIGYLARGSALDSSLTPAVATTLKSDRSASINQSYTIVRDDISEMLQDRQQYYQSKREEREQTQYWELSSRPLPETRSNEDFGWTGVDLVDSNDLKLISNNSRMQARLERENAWTNKRELVYLKEAFLNKAQQLITGESDHIDLPGFDGDVFKVIVPQDKLHLDRPGEMLGAFVGYVDGHPDQIVKAGMCGETWSVEIFQDGMQIIEITGRPDSGGEWVIAEKDLEKQHAAEGSIPCAQPRTPDDLARAL